MGRIEKLLKSTELTLNKEKTRIIQAKQEEFNFLGFTIRYEKWKYKAGNKYWNISPSIKSDKRLRLAIKEYLRLSGHLPTEIVAKELNAIIRGWMKYYSIERTTYIKRSAFKLRHYLGYRLYKHFQEKCQRGNKHYGYDAYDKLVKHNGLIDVINFAYKS